MPKTPATVGAGDRPIGIAADPGGASAYVVNNRSDTGFNRSDTVSQYDVAPDGTLSPKAPATVGTGDEPWGIAIRDDPIGPGGVYVTHIPDITGPTTTINSGPSGTVSSPNASFTFSANEAGAIFECSLDGGAFSPCSSPKAYAGLADGGHSFAVRSIDLSDNTGPAATRGWTVDTPPPPPPPPLELSLEANDRQKAKKLEVDVACGGVDCSVDFSGKGKVPRAASAVAAAKAKKFKLKPTGVEVAAGATETVRLKFRKNRKSVKKIKRLLKRGGMKTRRRAKAVVKATATGAGGTDSAKQKIKLGR